jgi:hypothetical protein
MTNDEIRMTKEFPMINVEMIYGAFQAVRVLELVILSSLVISHSSFSNFAFQK